MLDVAMRDPVHDRLVRAGRRVTQVQGQEEMLAQTSAVALATERFDRPRTQYPALL
jgi:hypothetical protein